MLKMIDTLLSAINQINQYEEQGEELSSKLSELDIKTQDILHYIENENFNASQGCILAKKIKELRIERRIIKNKLQLLNLFRTNSNKLVEKNNRKMLISELANSNKKLDNSKYHYEFFSKNKIDNLLNKNEQPTQ